MNAVIESVICKYKVVLHYIVAASPVMMLIVRLWISRIFFLSGMTKIHDFSNAIYLFQNEYHVPILPPVVAAVIGTTFELCCPVLLTLGLASRFAAMPLIVMTAVINFTYDNNIEHYYWAMLLGMIFFYGPGKLSLDHIISKKCTAKAEV